jgi:CBS domain containing-hemolysin-like protein
MTWLILVFLVFLSALFSGSETGFYSLSPLRLEADAEAGRGSARWIRRLLADEPGLLITILIGNNLAIELVTLIGEHRLSASGLVPAAWTDLVLTLTLTPILFFFAELVPKDLFRRRPYTLLAWAVRPMAAFYVVFWPLMILMRGLGNLVQRVLGIEGDEMYRVRGRERVFEVLEEGSRRGTLGARAEAMAKNALGLAALRVTDVMTPWARVEKLDLDAEDLAARVAAAEHSRLPVQRSGVVVGYLHQLEVLAAGLDHAPEEELHDLLCLDPETTVQAALARLRTFGKRASLVGELDAPLGLVSLKDLAERISGDLAGW